MLCPAAAERLRPDFTLGRDVTGYVLAHGVGTDGTVISIGMES